MKVNSTFGILMLIVTPVLAGVENIMRIYNTESWISTENFTTMVKKSFVYARCCNIYLSESFHEVQVLLHQFINIYPNEYLRRKIYDCQGYFLLGPTDKEIVKAMEKVPSFISTTEILIIINGELNHNSTLFPNNVSLYENSNANIVSRSGIWTLSENYLKPRFFLKVDSYEKLMSEFNMINLRGRELRVGSLYDPPTSYLNKTIKKVIDGVEQEVFLTDNDNEKDGIEMKIFLLIAEKLNFTWTIRGREGAYKYGQLLNGTWKGGIIGLVLEDKVDLAFGSIWLTQEHYEFVNMTEPLYQMFTHFLVPRPQPITNFWALTRPFAVDCWLFLLITLIVSTVYMYARAKIDPKFPKRFRSISNTIMELMGRLLGTWIPNNTANARIELLIWQIAGFVLVTAYSSSLAARLASSEYEHRIDTVHQFLEANLSWSQDRLLVVPIFKYYFNLDDPYCSQLPSRYISFKDNEIIHKLMKNRKFATLGNIIGLTFFPEMNIPNKDLRNYRVMKDGVGEYYTSFAVQPWLLRPINMVILWLKESGIAHFHLSDVIHRRASFNLREVLKEYDRFDGSVRILGLTPLSVGFTTLVIGLLISTIVFYLELKQAAGSRPIREVFRDIYKKRKVYEFSIKHKRK